MTQKKQYRLRGTNGNMVISEELDIVIRDNTPNTSMKNIVCNEIIMASFINDKDAIMIAAAIWTMMKRGKAFIDIKELVYGKG